MTLTNRQAVRDYHLAAYSGVVTFFGAETRDRKLLQAFQERTACRLEVIEVEGDHLTMVQAPHLNDFVHTLRAAMAASVTGASDVD